MLNRSHAYEAFVFKCVKMLSFSFYLCLFASKQVNLSMIRRDMFIMGYADCKHVKTFINILGWADLFICLVNRLTRQNRLPEFLLLETTYGLLIGEPSSSNGIDWRTRIAKGWIVMVEMGAYKGKNVKQK